MRRLRGQDRKNLVDYIIDKISFVKKSRAKHKLLLIVAPTGWGKTFLIQNVYKRLSISQSEPRYWPRDLFQGNNSDPLLTRKITRPAFFQVQKESKIEWFWWGVNCELSPDGRPIGSIKDSADQFYIHSLALESVSNPRVKKLLKSSGLDRGEDVFETGSSVLELLLNFGAITFPPLAFGLPLFNGVKRAYFHFKKTRDSFLNGKKLKKDRIYDLRDNDVRSFGETIAKSIIRISSNKLPVIILIEDLHNADKGLISFIDTILSSKSNIQIIATTWPDLIFESESIIELKNQRHELISTLNKEATEIHYLERLETEDLCKIVTDFAPRTTKKVQRDLVNHFSPNPLSLIQCFEFRKVKKSIKDDGIHLEKNEIDILESDIIDQYKRRWRELPTELKETLLICSFLGRSFIEEAIIQIAPDVGVKNAKKYLKKSIKPYAWTHYFDKALLGFIEADMHRLISRELRREFTEDELKILAQSYNRIFENGELKFEKLELNAKKQAFTTLLRLYKERYVNISDGQRFLMYKELGKIANTEHEYEKEADFLLEAYRIAPEKFELTSIKSLLEVLILLSRFKDADKVLTELNSRGFDSTQRLLLSIKQSELLAEEGKYQEAIEKLEVFNFSDYEETGEINTLVNGKLLMNRLYAEEGDFLKAKEQTWKLLDEIEGLAVDEELIYHSKLNLCWYLSRSGENKRALEIAHELMTELISKHGDKTPQTLDARNNYIRFLFRNGDIKKACELGRALVDDYEEVLGEFNLSTLVALDNLVRYEWDSKNFKSAKKLADKLIKRWTKIDLIKHPKALDSRRDYLWVSREVSDSKFQNEILELFDDYDAFLGFNHPNTIRAKLKLIDFTNAPHKRRILEGIVRHRESISSIDFLNAKEKLKEYE